MSALSNARAHKDAVPPATMVATCASADDSLTPILLRPQAVHIPTMIAPLLTPTCGQGQLTQPTGLCDRRRRAHNEGGRSQVVHERVRGRIIRLRRRPDVDLNVGMDPQWDPRAYAAVSLNKRPLKFAS